MVAGPDLLPVPVQPGLLARARGAISFACARVRTRNAITTACAACACACGAQFMLWLEHERARIIVLERQGLGRLVSQAVHDRRVQAGVAGPNGSAWCNSPECVARVTRDGSDLRVALPTARLADRLDREVVKWSALLTKLRRRFYPQMLHVSYDDLMAGTSYQMERIVTFLGANASLPIDLGATLKLTSERLGDSLVNADAVEAELRGTRWELAPPPDEEAAPAALNT